MNPDSHLYDPLADPDTLASAINTIVNEQVYSSSQMSELIAAVQGVARGPAQKITTLSVPFYVADPTISEHVFAGLSVPQYQVVKTDFPGMGQSYEASVGYQDKADGVAMGAYDAARASGASVSDALQAALATGPLHSQTGRVQYLVSLHQANEADAAQAMSGGEGVFEYWTRAGLAGDAPSRPVLLNLNAARLVGVAPPKPPQRLLLNSAVLSAILAPQKLAVRDATLRPTDSTGTLLGAAVVLGGAAAGVFVVPKQPLFAGALGAGVGLAAFLLLRPKLQNGPSNS